VQTRAEAGRAIAIVQCARGALMTAVRMQDGLIREPVIVAPTEWNFHPAGAAAHLLNTLAAGSFEAFEREARRSLLLFDACIPCSITEITSHA
jgi:Ni,Fe-hydrogenase I large subunit